jgi:uncharacterized protein (TIGR02145 family)
MKNFQIKYQLFLICISVLVACSQDTMKEILEEEDKYCESLDSIIDLRDGQTYKIVTIGEQVWFAENLRYKGNIPNITQNNEWYNFHLNAKPALCQYNNNHVNGQVHGYLYNWYAVNSENLCPPGWHIPGADEWEKLTEELGEIYNIGPKLKSTEGWSTGYNGTNTSCFNAKPSGSRMDGGDFAFLADKFYCWSSTEKSDYQATARALISQTYFSNLIESKGKGYSCRCVKDL